MEESNFEQFLKNYHSTMVYFIADPYSYKSDTDTNKMSASTEETTTDTTTDSKPTEENTAKTETPKDSTENKPLKKNKSKKGT